MIPLLARLASKGLPALMRGARGAPLATRGASRALGRRSYTPNIDPRMFRTARRPGMGRRAMDWMGRHPITTGLGAGAGWLGSMGLLNLLFGGDEGKDMPPSPATDMHPEELMDILRDLEGEPVTWGDDYTIGAGGEGAFDDVGRYIRPSDRVDSGEIDLLKLLQSLGD